MVKLVWQIAASSSSWVPKPVIRDLRSNEPSKSGYGHREQGCAAATRTAARRGLPRSAYSEVSGGGGGYCPQAAAWTK